MPRNKGLQQTIRRSVAGGPAPRAGIIYSRLAGDPERSTDFSRGNVHLACMYVCTYTRSVECEWDRRKAASNLRKHGVDFADAALVLHDDLALTVRDDL